LHRAIGASDPRLPAGQLIQPQRRASESVTVPWAQECAFNYDVRLKGQFCKIVGGETSPLAANVALDGMERLFGCEDRDGNPVKAVTKKGMDKSVVLIRYADDFLVTAPSKEILEQHVLPSIEAFLAERGLVLNQEKTRIVSIDEGFNFLGFTARKFHNGKLLITPEKAKVLAHLRRIKAYLNQNKQAPVGKVVRDLASVIRGWTLYYRHACSARTFQYADHRVWQMLWAWARRRHPTRSKGWVKAHYFRPIRSRVWNFADASVPGSAILPTAIPESSATRRSRGAPVPWTRTPCLIGTSGGGRDWRPNPSPSDGRNSCVSKATPAPNAASRSTRMRTSA
jgi:hypothetical protein